MSPQTTELALKVRLSPEARRNLTEQAAAVGRDLDEYASELLEHAVCEPSVDAVLAPLRKEFAESRVTDEQLIEQIEEARDEYRAAKARAWSHGTRSTSRI